MRWAFSREEAESSRGKKEKCIKSCTCVGFSWFRNKETVLCPALNCVWQTSFIFYWNQALVPRVAGGHVINVCRSHGEQLWGCWRVLFSTYRHSCTNGCDRLCESVKLKSPFLSSVCFNKIIVIVQIRAGLITAQMNHLLAVDESKNYLSEHSGVFSRCS